ncbi:hypothetical protein AVEN_176590-1, partial [Araneus ventricosus]
SNKCCLGGWVPGLPLPVGLVLSPRLPLWCLTPNRVGRQSWAGLGSLNGWAGIGVLVNVCLNSEPFFLHVSVHQNYVGADADKVPFFLSVVLTDANSQGVQQYRAILWRKTVSGRRPSWD